MDIPIKMEKLCYGAAAVVIDDMVSFLWNLFLDRVHPIVVSSSSSTPLGKALS